MDDLVQFLRARLCEDEAAALVASAPATAAQWSLDEWFGREEPHSLIAVGNAKHPTYLGHFTADPVPTAQATHIARHDPARVLAEVDAKRQILALHGPVTMHAGGGAAHFNMTRVCRSCEPPKQFPETAYPCRTLRLLALPYASRPDYRPEWAPDPA